MDLDYLRLPPPPVCEAIRKTARVSTGDLGRSIGVTAACIRQWETGKRTPRGERRRRYVAALRAVQDAA
jgi:DNA-binding transcriptional regulator YiaG